MKIVVDKLPATCGECPFKANGMVMTELGVPKEICLCTMQMTLIPPQNPNQPPNFIDPLKSPFANQCPCTDSNNEVSTDSAEERTVEQMAHDSGLILA